ncbi:MAG: hypothetical protein NVS9B1_11970 [Candidatus Dormibacteraceae bacterium]
MKQFIRNIALATGVVFTLVACGNSGSGSTPAPKASSSSSTTTTATAPDAKSAAADVRVKLNYLLGEHIVLASKATGAALGGRNAEFAAYGDLLNKNGNDIGDMIGSVYGDAAKTQFNGIWSAHNGFFVDYTKAVAAKDDAAKAKAVQNLTTIYVPQFSEFIAGATGLPKDTVAQLTTMHVQQTAAIVDAQAAKDWPTAYANIRKAYAHMRSIGDPLSEAIVAKNSSKIAGDPKNKAVDLRVTLDQALQEHLYLASFATGAALGGRNEEFAAAGNALNQNGTDIGAAIGSIYGQEAQTKFNGIWSAHNGFFVDYTKAVAAKDDAAKGKAVSNLTTVYVPQFSDFLAGATGLPKDAVANLTTMHVTTTAAVVDAQAAGDAAAAATKDRAAAQHMMSIGDPLAEAIVAKFPDKFQG